MNLYTTFSPEFKLQFTYVGIDETLTGKQDGRSPVLIAGTAGPGNSQRCTNTANAQVPCQPQTRGDNFAIIISPEITPFKGLDIKPMYSYLFINGATNTARQARGGVVTLTSVSGASGAQTNSPFAPASTSIAGSTSPIGGADGSGTGVHENRHTIGVDARYRMGPFQLDPSFYYQFGSRQAWLLGGGEAPYGIQGTKKTADISAWLVDVRGGFQFGPLLLQSMVMWTSGDHANTNPYKHIGYYQPLDTDSGYLADWGTHIFSLGIEYNQAFVTGPTFLGSAIGYDKYGRIQFGAKASYAITPALTVGVGVTPNWTDKKVDTDGFVVTNGGIRPNFTSRKFGTSVRPEGESNYLGTELNAALTYRFAPGLAFDWQVGYLFSGNALVHRWVGADYGVIAPNPRDIGVSDVIIMAARVRFSF